MLVQRIAVFNSNLCVLYAYEHIPCVVIYERDVFLIRPRVDMY